MPRLLNEQNWLISKVKTMKASKRFLAPQRLLVFRVPRLTEPMKRTPSYFNNNNISSRPPGIKRSIRCKTGTMKKILRLSKVPVQRRINISKLLRRTKWKMGGSCVTSMEKLCWRSPRAARSTRPERPRGD